MYKKEYDRWLTHITQPELLQELNSIRQDDLQIKDRFLLNLAFGTAGLRGVLGAGTNRMNIYTVAKATQGLANYLKKQTQMPSVAIAYDSRINSELFAQISARVLAASGIKVYIYSTLMPTPMLSYAVRAYQASAGIMVTASHNPAKYNGYKVYGSDGCQMTSESADAVLEEINTLDIFNDIQMEDFGQALAQGKIEYISQQVIDSYYDWCLAQMMRKDIFKQSPLKVIYTPLNGTGNIPVRHVLAKAGLCEIQVVKQQELPDGNFPTCPYPNPEIKQAMELGLQQLEATQGDLLIATDPDADRVGIAVKDKQEYVMLSGNQVGILLVDYIAKTRKELNTMPKDAVIVKSIVTSSLADAVAQSHDITTINVLTGFKYIGETIKKLEKEGKEDSFLLGFEESYGYLAGTKVRDKDAVVATLLITEMAAYYALKGCSLVQALEEIYKIHGYYLNKVDSYEFEGLSGMEKMQQIMQDLRRNPFQELGGISVQATEDYQALLHIDLQTGKQETIHLPKANILVYYLQGGHQIIVRPSGTEPKVKVYYSIKGDSMPHAQEIKKQIEQAILPFLQ